MKRGGMNVLREGPHVALHQGEPVDQPTRFGALSQLIEHRGQKVHRHHRRAFDGFEQIDRLRARTTPEIDDSGAQRQLGNEGEGLKRVFASSWCLPRQTTVKLEEPSESCIFHRVGVSPTCGGREALAWSRGSMGPRITATLARHDALGT